MSLGINNPTISAIGSAIKHNQVVTAVQTSNGTIEIKPLGLFARLWHWNDKKFHEARLTDLVSIVTKVISAQQRLTIAAAAEDTTLKVARNLLKDLKKQNINISAISDLKKEVVAAKLGISTITLDSNPGLQKFTEQYHLERYLLTYNHPFVIDQGTQEISLLKNGGFQPWNQIFKESQSWQTSTRSPKLSWVYGPEGIQNKDMYDWTELKPFLKGDPADWNHEYVFEFCACFNPHSIKNGNHSWFRLKTPTGDVYSVGLYEPGKGNVENNVKSPLRIKPAFLMQPDVSEFWDFPISTIGFTINEETFLKIKQTVENDKNTENLIFQLFNNNCVLYSKKLALIGGVDLPARDNILNFIIPAHVNRNVSSLMDKMPVFVQKISLFVAAFFLNITQSILGGYKIDKLLNENQKKLATPHLKTFKDLFDVNKIYLNHPSTLAFKTGLQVLEWRKKEIETLQQTESDAKLREEKEKQINLSLPPSYYTTAVLV